jgi:hypothetical protein
MGAAHHRSGNLRIHGTEEVMTSWRRAVIPNRTISEKHFHTEIASGGTEDRRLDRRACR